MGQNTKEIKKRIVSVRNTRKITRTMEMVSTAKSKKSQDRVRASQPYNHKLREIIGNLAGGETSVDHPLLQANVKSTNQNEQAPILLFVIVSNRGLCGAYNTNVLKMARDQVRQWESQGRKVQVEVIGKKGISFFRFNKINVTKSYWDISDSIKFETFEPISQRIMDSYLAGEIDSLHVVYTKYLSASKQEAAVEKFLPFSLDMIMGKPGKKESAPSFQANYIYEPAAEIILKEMLPYAFKMNFFQALLESFTAEHIYRRIAMKSATDAASDMIKSLNLSYNRARQAKITQEIAEIIGGVNALNG